MHFKYVPIDVESSYFLGYPPGWGGGGGEGCHSLQAWSQPLECLKFISTL